MRKLERAPPSFSSAELGFLGRMRDSEFISFLYWRLFGGRILGYDAHGPGSDIGLNQILNFISFLYWRLE